MKKSIQHAMARVKTVMSCKGEGYVDSGVKILIAVVLGSLLLFALYTLFKNFGYTHFKLKDRLSFRNNFVSKHFM